MDIGLKLLRRDARMARALDALERPDLQLDQRRPWKKARSRVPHSSAISPASHSMR
jgi:hypothetical protein